MPDIDEMTLPQIGAEIEGREPGCSFSLAINTATHRWSWRIGLTKEDGKTYATRLDAARAALRYVREEVKK